jgi:hypothetical protein
MKNTRVTFLQIFVAIAREITGKYSGFQVTFEPAIMEFERNESVIILYLIKSLYSYLGEKRSLVCDEILGHSLQPASFSPI